MALIPAAVHALKSSALDDGVSDRGNFVGLDQGPFLRQEGRVPHCAERSIGVRSANLDMHGLYLNPDARADYVSLALPSKMRASKRVTVWMLEVMKRVGQAH